MIPNVKPSKLYPSKTSIAPQSVAAAATITSGWIDTAGYAWAKIASLVGAGAGTFAVKLEQATSAAGGGAKDLATAASLGITAQATGTASQADAQLGAQGVDVDNGFRYIRASATCAGGAGTLYALELELGPEPYLS
jgi:hypothetical protein